MFVLAGGSQRTISGIASLELYTLIFKRGPFTGPKVSKEARLADQRVPGIYRSLLP